MIELRGGLGIAGERLQQTLVGAPGIALRQRLQCLARRGPIAQQHCHAKTLALRDGPASLLRFHGLKQRVGRPLKSHLHDLAGEVF